MADEIPSKLDIQAVFKRLRAVSTNKVCFDCSAKNPTWASVTYGVFICIDCSAVHRSLGVHLSFVRSTQLDTNWTWVQLRHMQLGGNANATTFFCQHNCTSTDAQQKYNSRAAHLYREKLHQMAVQAMRLHGNKLHLNSAQPEPVVKEEKSIDFFEELTQNQSAADLILNSNMDSSSRLMQQIEDRIENGNSIPQGQMLGDVGQPSVEAALSTSPTEAMKLNASRKATIGQRKPVVKKAGLGAKKGGLGAQKVKADFAEIEREAHLADEMREKMVEEAKVQATKKAEEEEKQLASMRLAYQDLSLQRKKEEDKLKHVDPKKAEQVERLGMGFGSRTGISHSAISDMHTIEQETPTLSRSTFDRRVDDFLDDFEIIGGYSKYKSPSFESKLGGTYSVESDLGFSSKKKSSSMWDDDFGSVRKSASATENLKEPEERPRRDVVSSAPSTNEAQKKFGNAKAISSEQFFQDTGNVDMERRANLSRFEGSSSISSADYFGRTEERPGSAGAAASFQALQTPDFEDVKESVRQGVTKVAGKISSLANGMLHSLERYGNNY